MHISRKHCFGSTYMKHKVMDCLKSWQSTIWMCRHSFVSRQLVEHWRSFRVTEHEYKPEKSKTGCCSTTQIGTNRRSALWTGMSHREGFMLPPLGHIPEHWGHSAWGGSISLFHFQMLTAFVQPCMNSKTTIAYYFLFNQKRPTIWIGKM